MSKKEDIEKLNKFLTLKQVDVMEVFDIYIGSLPDQERAVIENNIENPIDQTDFKNLKERKILRKFRYSNTYKSIGETREAIIEYVDKQKINEKTVSLLLRRNFLLLDKLIGLPERDPLSVYFYNVIEHFYDDEKVSFRETYKNGKNYLKWEFFDEEGNLTKTEKYKDGELIE